MPMDIILHIGMEKTGTTTLQEFLHRNRERLLEHGFYFLQSAGLYNNREIPAYCMRAELFDDFFWGRLIDTPAKKAAFRADFLRRFDAEIQAIPAHVKTVIASSEHFHSRLIHDDEIETLKDLLSRYFEQIKVVTYIRRQVDASQSLYSTALRNGKTATLAEFVDEDCQPTSKYFDYADYLDRWSRGFGKENLSVRLFEPAEFVNRNLIDDFISLIDPEIGAVVDKDVHTQNEAINVLGQNLLRSINKYVPQFIESVGQNSTNLALVELISEKAKGKGASLDPETSASIQARFSACNETVRRTFFAERRELFPERRSAPEQEALTPVDIAVLDDVIRLLSQAQMSEPTDDTPVPPPILLRKIADLSEQLTDMTSSRALLHGQLVSTITDLKSVTANRDALRAQYDAVSLRAAAREAELSLLKNGVLNRLRLRAWTLLKSLLDKR